MKVHVTINEREIVIEQHHPVIVPDGLNPVDECIFFDGLYSGVNLSLYKCNILTIDRQSGAVSISATGCYHPEATCTLPALQFQAVEVSVQTRKRLVRKPQKTASVMLVSNVAGEAPLLIFKDEPYASAMEVASQVAEALNLPLREKTDPNPPAAAP